jgi:ABC-2 type transport system permease protein
VKAVIRLINAEIFKLRKRLMTSVLLYVMIGIIVVLYFTLLAVANAQLPARAQEAHSSFTNLLGLPVAIPFALSILFLIGRILAVILLASSIGFEYNWRTIRTMVISSEGRLKLLIAKLISALVFILIGMIITLVAGFIMSLITTAIGHYSFDFSFITRTYLWDQFLQFWRTLFVMLPYVLLGFLFSIVGRSAMPGIALGISIIIFEPIITGFMDLAGGWVAEIPKYLIAANVGAITALNQLPTSIMGGFGGGGGAEAPSVAHAFITLSIYSVVFIGIAFYLFRKRDVTG